MNDQIIRRAKFVSSLATALGWWLLLLFSIGWTSKKLIESGPITIIDFVIPFVLSLVVIRSTRRCLHFQSLRSANPAFHLRYGRNPMSTTWSKEIDEILSTGSPLHDSGVNNWALSRDRALAALDRLEASGVAVLGGDVYLKTDGGIRGNCDNWYFDIEVSELNTRRVRDSIERARDYIRHYPLPDALFALVPLVRD